MPEVLMKAKEKNAKEKKNSIFKNAFIVYSAMFKRYPTAIPLVIVYLVCAVTLPFINTLIPALAIKGITSGSAQNFMINIGIAVSVFCVFTCIKVFCEKKMQLKHTYVRLGVFMVNFLKKAINTDYLNIEPQPKQKIMGKGIQGVSGTYQGAERVSTTALYLLVVMLGVLSYGTVIFMLDWKIIAVMIGMFTFDILLRNHAVKYGDNNRELSTEPWRKMGYLERNSMNISAGKDTRIFNLKGLFSRHFDSHIKTYKKFRSKYQLLWYYPTLSDSAFNFARDWLAYTLLIHKVLSGQIDAAEFTIYIGLVASFSEWIYDVSWNFAELREASHQFNDYHEFMNQKDVFERHEESAASSGAAGAGERSGAAACGAAGGARNGTRASESAASVPPTPPEPAKRESAKPPQIEFRHVSFTYEGSDKPVLKDVNFNFRANEKIALVGNNGAGKTTIVKLLCGLYPPTTGEILIDGKSINDIGVEKYQDMISVLFQDTSPIALSIAENIAGCELADMDRERVRSSLKEAGLLEKIDSLSNKEETYITQTLNENGVVLSGGETQKLLLAKAMYKDGPVLILDEPTSALDPIAESRIYEEYNNMAANKTAVFISHRLASTKFCDRILFLDDGQIVEEGTHGELMEKGSKYREIFDIQSHYYKESVPEDEEGADASFEADTSSDAGANEEATDGR
jgi:ATP-binding cassette subfamily B protein